MLLKKLYKSYIIGKKKDLMANIIHKKCYIIQVAGSSFSFLIHNTGKVIYNQLKLHYKLIRLGI